MEGLENFKDLMGNNVNDFVTKYRDAMKENYDQNISTIENQRRNDYQSIMSQANKRGMMYSNFPERSKIQYDADTYLPNLKSAYTSYQTGLDKLRSSALSAYNNIKETQAQIDHVNALAKISDDAAKKSNTGMNITWGKLGTKDGGTWYYDNDGNPVRMSTWLRKNGYADTTEGYLKGAQALNTAGWMSDADYKALTEEANGKNLGYNANGYGGSYQDYTYDGMDSSRQSLINSLGLRIY